MNDQRLEYMRLMVHDLSRATDEIVSAYITFSDSSDFHVSFWICSKHGVHQLLFCAGNNTVVFQCEKWEFSSTEEFREIMRRIMYHTKTKELILEMMTTPPHNVWPCFKNLMEQDAPGRS